VPVCQRVMCASGTWCQRNSCVPTEFLAYLTHVVFHGIIGMTVCDFQFQYGDRRHYGEFHWRTFRYRSFLLHIFQRPVYVGFGGVGDSARYQEIAPECLFPSTTQYCRPYFEGLFPHAELEPKRSLDPLFLGCRIRYHSKQLSGLAKFAFQILTT